MGVILFFVLSGFLIGSLLLTEMQRYSHVNTARFLIRRGFKLYPVYYLFIAYCVLMPVLKACLSNENISNVFSSSLGQYLTSLVFLQNYIAPNPAGHTWSLAVEEHFYLVLPFVILLLGPKRVWKWLIPICLCSIPICAGLRVLSIVHQQAAGGIVLSAQNASHLHVDALMIGVALAVTAIQFPDHFIQLGRFPRTLVIMGLILWVIPCAFNFSILSWAAFGSTMWILGSAGILVGFCSFKNNDVIVNKRGITAWIGANSYAIYVWHVTVIGITEKYLLDGFLTTHINNEGFRWLVLVAISAILCIFVGATVTKMIETPALSLRDRFFPSRGHAITLPSSKLMDPITRISENKTDHSTSEWTLISATNNNAILNSCLLSSPDIQYASNLLLQRGFNSTAEAYNAAIAEAKTDLLVFVHQDVYLPEGWIMKVQEAIKIMAETDPNWGVLGVWGTKNSTEHVGFIYDGAWRRVLGAEFQGGREVDSLDEVVLIMRKPSGLRFDPQIPGFHMYGADICQEAKRQGKKCYALAAFCIHNTNQYKMLPWQFWKAYLKMRRKWNAYLPLRTTCIEITHWCWPMLRWNLVRGINLITGRDSSPVGRVENPSQLYFELVNSGKVNPLVQAGNVLKAG